MLLNVITLKHFLLHLCNSTGVPRAAQHHKAEEDGYECNYKNFMLSVGAKISSKWRTFGICAGVGHETLKGVAAQKFDEQHLYFAEIFSNWENEHCESVTWAAVIEILESSLMNEKALANELKEKYHVA